MRRPTVLLVAASLVLAVSPLLTQVAHATTGPAVQVTPQAASVLPYDFNGDGYAEIAVGTPGEDIGSGSAKIVDAGVVTVIPGSAAGPVYAEAVEYSQDTPGITGLPEKEDYFGGSLTSGDYDGDSFADLAIGTANENGTARDQGFVTVMFGSSTGLQPVGSQSWYPVSDTDAFATGALATGNFDGDLKDDLVIGLVGIQAVAVYENGLNAAKFFSDGNLPGAVDDDTFGFALAAGDTTGDGNDELAIGDPYDFQTYGWSAGAVTLVIGSATGLTTAGAVRWTVDSPGIKGTAHTYTGVGDDKYSDSFGFQVALGDVTGDGLADLLATAPGTPVTRDGKVRQDAGELHMIPGSATGLTDIGDLLINQETAGIPGLANTGDYMGNTLAVDDMDGDGDADTAMAISGEEGVMLLPGGPTFGTTGKTWTQDTDPAIPGTKESEDGFGDLIRWESVTGTTQKQLVIGAPGEDASAGSVWMFNTTGSQLSMAGIKVFNQDTVGIPGLREPDDYFGVL